MTAGGAAPGGASLLDGFLPGHHVAEVHETVVRAPVDVVYRAVLEADLAGHPLSRALLVARAIPGALLARRRTARWADVRAPLTLRDFCRFGFVELHDDPPRAIVLGLTGRFWRPGGGLLRSDAHTFAGAGQPPGTARAAWSFTLEPLDAGRTRLRTETRVRCSDARSRRLFAAYWVVVGPASGLIRRLMLRAIRRRAEGRGGIPGEGRTAA